MISPYRAVRLVALSACLLQSTVAIAREPMKVGNTALDQRVLTRPDAVIWHGLGSADAHSRPPVFSAYYVFDRQNHNGEEWAEIGARRTGVDTLWIKSNQTVDWKQTIVLGFTNPANRLPTLFFQQCEDLTTFLADEAMSTRAELIVSAIRENGGTGDGGVIAMEPEEHVSITEQFYMLPILEHRRVAVNRRPKRIVRVASINLNDQQGSAVVAEPGDFNVGIVFVIDTSTSMQPYIDSTKAAVRDLLSNIQASEIEVDFSFGLVGFRSSTAIVPDLEYTAREYMPLRQEFDEAAFDQALDRINATAVSSHDFDEDGLSGLTAAASGQDWDAFDGRYIIYVSDAGMLVGTDNGASTDTTPELLSARLQNDLGIATFAMFLKSRSGRAYHDDSMAQLEQFTRSAGSERSFLFPIENADVAEFQSAVSSLTESLLQNVSTLTAERAEPPDDDCEETNSAITCAANDAGYAMRLAWLGRQQQTQAPDTYEACAADFALDDPSRRAMSPRVLLTRAQLNDTYITLQAISEAFREVSEQSTATEFFSVLKTVLGRVMRDPGTLQSLDATQSTRAAAITEFDDLGDLLGDYLDDLPYDSELATETLERWIARGASGQYEFMEGLRSKLAMYELYYADTDNWIALTTDAPETEKVYPIPLEMMP